jgi:hypothetical protein
VIAQGNALGKSHNNAGSAEGAKQQISTENIEELASSLSFRAFSARNLNWIAPGPMAQGGVPSRASRLGCETVTFRAFGAENPEFSHSLLSVVERKHVLSPRQSISH